MATKKKDVEDRREQIQALFAKTTKFKQAREVLTKVRSIKTILPQFNIASGVGGYPIERTSIVHGPPGMGKTKFILGIGKSFILQNGVFALVDAEYTTNEEWIDEMFAELSESELFRALRPTTYEETIEAVREMAHIVPKLREEKLIPEEASCFIAVDSLAKLIPKDTWDKLQKEEIKDKEGGLDGRSGRGGQQDAWYNARWFKELTPLLYHTKTGFAAIGREVANPDAGMFQPKTKLSGGSHSGFESSMTIRITREGFVTEGGKIVGECHLGTITKSKVASKEGKVTKFRFHTLIKPSTFDIHRDVLMMATDTGVIEKAPGGMYLYEGEKIARGEPETVKYLRENPETFAKIQAAAESLWTPAEEDEAG